MLLAVDIGNTNIVAALFEGDALRHNWRIFSDTRRTGDEYGSILRSLFHDASVEIAAVRSSVLSSVVPALTAPFVGMISTMTGQKPLLVNPQIFPKLPIKISEDVAHEIGGDLVCNAVEAWCRFKGACIVGDFGTALSFIAVGSLGHIRGAAIAPGIGTAIKSLFSNAAQLPTVPLEAPSSTLGLNTIQSIQAGVVLGYQGLVESLVNRMKAELAEKEGIAPGDIHVIATGGLNNALQPLTAIFQQVDKELTIRGLKRIAELAII
ncbi:MAG: type III pantothenate kinase [Treponema sp.]|jgi:type III pantothenate kinase|nr:type III pantothenate kinase [Treponema sp.]